jgi:hypothetical protein
MSSPIFQIVGGKMLRESVGQGYGRHTKEEGSGYLFECLYQYFIFFFIFINAITITLSL